MRDSARMRAASCSIFWPAVRTTSASNADSDGPREQSPSGTSARLNIPVPRIIEAVHVPLRRCTIAGERPS